MVLKGSKGGYLQEEQHVSRCHRCQVSTLHWALSGWPVDWAAELLEAIEGHSVLLRPASEAAQLGGWPEAEMVSQVSGLSAVVTSESKHGQTRQRHVSDIIHRECYSLLGYPGVRSGVGKLIWKFESEDMRSKMDGFSVAERIRI